MEDKEASAMCKLMQDYSLSFLQACAVTEGRLHLDEVLTQKAAREKAQKLAKKPIGKWPCPAVTWDLNAEHWHLSMDDHDQESFTKTFPDAELVWVNLSQLQDKLADRWRRKKNPISAQYRDKTSTLVVHLENGGSISPPMIIFAAGELHIAGGNHRLGWALHTNQADVPIIIRGSERSSIQELVQLHEADRDNRANL